MTTVKFPTIWLPQWVVSFHFEIIIPIWMFQSLFSLSLPLSSIDKYYLQILFSFSHYCSISIIVLVIHKYGIIWYQILFWIGISMICNKTHVSVYSHFVVVAALHFISLFVLDIDFEFIFIITLSINDIDVHFHNQFHYCCYSYLPCCLLDLDR